MSIFYFFDESKQIYSNIKSETRRSTGIPGVYKGTTQKPGENKKTYEPPTKTPSIPTILIYITSKSISIKELGLLTMYNVCLRQKIIKKRYFHSPEIKLSIVKGNVVSLPPNGLKNHNGGCHPNLFFLFVPSINANTWINQMNPSHQLTIRGIRFQ